MLRLALSFLILSLPALSCTEPGVGFLPKNDLQIPVSAKNAGLSEAEYHEVINKVEKVYAPVARLYGARLVMERKWESETVNAGTLRMNGGKKWVVNLYGGFPRHPEITRDGYALVICHEIGHHIGGAPKKLYEHGRIWASTEGQSDYFATLKCLRKVFRNEDNLKAIKDLKVPKFVQDECQKSFPTNWEIALCVRTAMAGLSVAKVNASIRRVDFPELGSVDASVVTSTQNAHPIPQCRLDTYFEGSICSVPSSQPLSQVYEEKGTCHRKRNHTRGLRPLCWYKGK